MVTRTPDTHVSGEQETTPTAESTTRSPHEPPVAGSGLDKSISGWRSLLAISVSTLLLLLGATGLWIYLGPFSAAGQLQVILHTLLGLALVIPYAVYQYRHWRTWSGQRITAELVLG